MGLASAQQAFIRQTGQKPPLPEGWKEEFDEVTKASFYIHEESGERTWVRPGFLPPGFMGGGPIPSSVVMNAACKSLSNISVICWIFYVFFRIRI